MPETERFTICSGEEVYIFDGDDRRDLQSQGNWSKGGVIQPVNGHWLLPKAYLNYDEKLYNFSFRSTDVFVIGYPKSGTCWTSEIIWTIINNPNLNHSKKSANILARVPHFEMDMLKFQSEWFKKSMAEVYDIPMKTCYLDTFEDIPDNRIFKSHANSSTVNRRMIDTVKMVYIVRDPLDSCYSYYLYQKYWTSIFGMSLTMSEFVNNYITGEILTGNAVEHILSWWPFLSSPNFYFVYYENLKKDPAGEIRKLEKFLGKQLMEEQVQNVIYQTSFEKMKEDFTKTEGEMNKSLKIEVIADQKSFIRKGIVGDSKNFPDEIYNKLVSYFKRSLKDVDLPYKFNTL